MQPYIKLSLAFALLITHLTLRAQTYDYDKIWVNRLGAGTFNLWDVSTTPPAVSIVQGKRRGAFTGENASMCDTAGNLLFYSNGRTLFNAAYDTMQGGELLVADPSWSDLSMGTAIDSQGNTIFLGYNSVFSSLALPFPHAHKYWVFQSQTTYPYTAIDSLGQWMGDLCAEAVYGSQVDMSIAPYGAVSQGLLPIITDTSQFAMAACRHGNGRDWWMVVPIWGDSGFHRILVTENGLTHDKLYASYSHNISGLIYPKGEGYVTFSSDGTRLVVLGAHRLIHIWDFDRCNGAVSNYRYWDKGDTAYYAGYRATLSPNGRYLYAVMRSNYFQSVTYGKGDILWQYDLDSPNCTGTVLAQTNLFTSAGEPVLNPPSPITLDGKIYVPGDSTLHIIQYPDSGGLACGLQLNAKLFGKNISTIFPNHQHYRLGAAQSSGCDTLGLPPLYAPLSATYKLTDHACVGIDGTGSGAATAIIKGGMPPYQYLWSTGATTPTINNVLSGNYTCTITDAVGKVVIDTVTIATIPPLSASSSSVASTQSWGNGMAVVYASGGTPPYQYVWETGANIDTLFDALNITYTCVITDVRGCTLTVSVLVGSSGISESIQETQIKEIIKAYPNPAGDEITFYTPISYPYWNERGVIVVLLDMLGREVLHGQVGTSISISHLPNGVYLWQCSGQSGKLIISR